MRLKNVEVFYCHPLYTVLESQSREPDLLSGIAGVEAGAGKRIYKNGI